MNSFGCLFLIVGVAADVCESDVTSALQNRQHFQIRPHEVCKSVEIGQIAPIDGFFTPNEGDMIRRLAQRGDVAESAGRFCVDWPTMALLQREFSVSHVSEFETLLQKKNSTGDATVDNTMTYKSGGSEQVPEQVAKQVQGLLRAAEPATTWSLARCPSFSSAKPPLEVSLTSTKKAAVICCFANSDQPIMNNGNFPGGNCKTTKYAEALALCEGLGNGKTLCTRKQLTDGVQCGSGCGNLDSKRFWSLAPPVTDEFGCSESGASALDGKLKVRKLCLPEKIAGPLMNNVFRGPMPMHAVADRTQRRVAYFSWTADLPYGKSTDDGRVYVSKLSFADGEPKLQGSASFDGFVRSGGIDITEEGTLGTLCAKYVPSWVQACVGRGDNIGNCPLALAVCEVDAATMKKKGTPWRIGKQYQTGSEGDDTGIWGSYAIEHWWGDRSAGSGYLVYAPKTKQWTAWYGATVGGHTGYAMHTYERDALPLSVTTIKAYENPLPKNQIEHRQETLEGDFADHSRRGTGDHQGGAAWHYHSGLKDIGLLKHTHNAVYMQQYGLKKAQGVFKETGHSTGRLVLEHDDDKAVLEGGLRQCGNGWILALITEQGGNVCARVNKKGVIKKWVSIEASVGAMPCNPNGKSCGDGRKGGLTRIAPLGAADMTDGANARFLFGYEKSDRSRWLVEVDGDCVATESTRKDVTQHTTWPTVQDWITTADGAVVWVTSWAVDSTSNFGPAGSPNSVATYPSPRKDNGADADYRYLRTTGATNEAEVTVYYP